MNTYIKGNLSEAIVTARLLERGYQVFIPVGGGHRYDLIIEWRDHSFKKIQVKTGRVNGGSVVFNTCSNNKGYKRKSYHGEIDFFAVYSPELKECYLVPVEKTGSSEMRLRITPVKNNQVKLVNYKNDFILK